MTTTDLEGVIGRELTKLRAVAAPPTLLPRVLAAVQTWSRRPWYTRAWFTWPVAGQLASVIALLLMAVGSVTWLLPAIFAAAGTATSSALIQELALARERVALTTNVAGVLWRALVEPVVPYVFALVVPMCVACAAFGTALNHAVFGGTFHT